MSRTIHQVNTNFTMHFTFGKALKHILISISETNTSHLTQIMIKLHSFPFCILGYFHGIIPTSSLTVSLSLLCQLKAEIELRMSLCHA